MKFLSRFILVLIIPTLACVNVKSQKNKPENNSYVDFDKLRPEFPIVNFDSLMSTDSIISDTVFIEDAGIFMLNRSFDDSLIVLMDTLAKLNKSIPYWGYRIVLYTGSDRQQAIHERGKVLKLLGDEETKVYMNYERPYFKVKIGNYYNRITAFPSFVQIKKQFPTALLVPEVIDLNHIQFK